LAHIESEDDGTTPATNKVILEATTRIWPGQIHGLVSKRRAIPEAQEALEAIAMAWRAMDPALDR
ncbi:hypothetical protein AB9E20_34290, partial [Rhizobium leguminosarum]